MYNRSGYSDELDPQELAMYRGAVASAIRGKRGQALLRDLRTALDEMPVKALVANDLITTEGEVCALGAVALKRGIVSIGAIDPEDHEALGAALNIAPCLAAEIEFVNDDDFHSYIKPESPEERWGRLSRWVDRHLKGATSEPAI